MQNILLLVQTESDIAALPLASREIKKSGVDGVWLVFSPAVLVNSESASKEHDAAIRDITEAMKSCAARLDFEGAKNYKTKLDEAMLQKSESVKNAYKKMPPDQQKAAFDTIFKPFTENPPCSKIKITQHSDHYDPSNWIEMLNSLKGAWFEPFAPGTFNIAWPTSFSETKSVVQKSETTAAPEAPRPSLSDQINSIRQTASTDSAPKKPNGTKVTATPEFRQLVGMGLDGLGHEAIRIGIDPNGKNFMALAHAVYKKKYGTAEQQAA